MPISNKFLLAASKAASFKIFSKSAPANPAVFLGRDIAQQKNFSEQTSNLIDEEVKAIINNAYNKAVDILNSNMDKLHAVANVLLEKETIDGEEFQNIMNS